jgi:imidazolonepropionase-like amidohydrolase
LHSTVSKHFVIAVLLTLVCMQAHAQEFTAIVHGRIIDGNGGTPIEDGVVLVQGKRIAAVGPASTVRIPKDARVIDATGKSVLPGLADMHVHLFGGWDSANADMLGYRRYLNTLLYAGNTTVLDLGNSLPYIQQLRQEVSAGRLAGPTIRMAGPAIDGANPSWPPFSMALSSAAQIPVYLRQLKAAQVDFVKGYAGLSDQQLSALVKDSDAQSLRVLVDVGSRNGTAAVAATGVFGFAHVGVVPLTDETVSIMRDHKTVSITTLTVYESNSRRRLADLGFLRAPLLAQTMPPQFVTELTAYASRPLSAEERAFADKWGARLRVAMANAKRLSADGFLLVAGTDVPGPGIYYGEALHRELELLVEAGLTPLQALSTATRNAAVLMNEESQWGTLEVGRKADILVVKGNPAARISDTRNIEVVMQSGSVLDRQSLRFDPKNDPGFQPAGAAQAAE